MDCRPIAASTPGSAAYTGCQAAELMRPRRRPRRVIEPYRGLSLPDWREVWSRRDLIYFLASRDVSVRYKQTVVGAAWAVLQPLLLAGDLQRLPRAAHETCRSEGHPYALFALAPACDVALLLRDRTGCSESTVEERRPDLEGLLPAHRGADRRRHPAPAVDFVVAFVVLFAISSRGFAPEPRSCSCRWFRRSRCPSPSGSALWLSALVVRYRDVSLVVPFLILVGCCSSRRSSIRSTCSGPLPAALRAEPAGRACSRPSAGCCSTSTGPGRSSGPGGHRRPAAR